MPTDLRPAPELPAGGGLLLVDKPANCTSHDVVSLLRHVLRTKKVGHAGTLDPMATGLLVLAVDRSTKLLGHLALTDKTYFASIRLGEQTDSDDADGIVISTAESVAHIGDDAIRAGVRALTGDLLQVPSSVSAIKVDGRRAYDLVRAGETVQLAARPVTVSRFDIIGAPRHLEKTIDLDVVVDCTTGTYIRSLARDLGAALGIGGHLTRLRRTRVGPFGIVDAVDVFGAAEAQTESGKTGPPRLPVTEEFAARIAAAIIPAIDAVHAAFPIRTVDAAQALDLQHGRFISAAGISGTYGVIGPDQTLVALAQDRDGRSKSVLGWQING
ncbi:MAG: tRNA pseudouridine(55) synthase TruB [Nakamurella sp.]